VGCAATLPAMRYDDAVASLYQVPLDQFVAERKRLAGELKAAGDKQGAARLAKCARPPISAWIVDQLWWHARTAFGALFDTAQQLRDGKLAATAAHREALGRLRAHAAKLLGDAGHGANEATLRRVTQTLSALAAAGGWEPDLPGALSADRDPPGFEAIGIPSNVIPVPVRPAAPSAPAAPSSPAAPSNPVPAAPSTPVPAAPSSPAPTAPPSPVPPRDAEAAEAERRREHEAAAARAEAAAELRRAEAQRARAAAERNRLEAALRTAQGDVEQREREVARLARDLAAAHHMVAQAKAVAAGLAERLAQLDN